MDNENEKLGAARKYVDACKQHGPTAERERMHDALYKTPGCKIYIGNNRSIIDEMRDCLPHTTKDVHDATAMAIHVDIPRENEFIREEKTAKRQLDAELETRIREFGEMDCHLDSEVHEGSLLEKIVHVDIKDYERTAIDRLIEVSKELCQCKIFEEERYRFIKAKLQVSSEYFIKSQFNHDEEIFTVNVIAFPSSVEIRASQREMESGDWIVHDFTIDAETKEVKHEIFEVANNEADLQFVKDGSIT